ncbi:MAG: peptide deformylase [Candidatus Zixiibacteriota bacterium]
MDEEEVKRKLCYLDDEVLREKSALVEAFGPDEARVVEAMAQVMIAHRGAGLAAPQIGVLKRIIIIHPSILPEGADTVLLNPEIVECSKETETEEEGCLSLLSVAAPLARPSRVVVRYVDTKGREREFEAEGMAARALQHEIDHLNGVLFIDHLSRLKRKFVCDRFRKLYRELEAGHLL